MDSCGINNLNNLKMNREELKKQIVINFEKDEITEKERLTNVMQCIDAHVEQLSIPRVSKCADEVIKYIENDAEIAMPVNELMHEDGRHLSKKEYGHVLLKYLIVELKERFC